MKSTWLKSETSSYPQKTLLSGFVSIIVTIAALLMLVKLLGACAYGLDFIDEGFYLNWISFPSTYKIFTTQFGFVYHFLYQLVDQDLVSLRQANVLINYVLAFVLVRLGLSMTNPGLGGLFLNATSLSLASAALLILVRTDAWIATPYYNTLAFQGAIVFFIGLLINCYANRFNWLSSLLIGLGGWLVYLGKPPSAAFLVIVLVLFTLFDKSKGGLRTVIYSGFASFFLLILSAAYISGSLLGYVKSLQDGIYSLNLFDAGHAKGVLGFLRLDSIYLRPSSILIFILVFLGSFLSVYFSLVAVLKKQFGLLVHLFRLAVIVVNLAFILGYLNSDLFLFRFYMLAMFAMLLGILLGLVFRKCIAQFNYKRLMLIIISFLMPYILAVGSNNNYWQLASSASFFSVFSLILLINNEDEKYSYTSLSVIASIVFLLVSLLISTSQLVPYNQLVPLSSLNSSVNLPVSGRTLYVREDVKSYIKHLDTEAVRLGLNKGTQIIDLTGHYGSSVYLLGMRSLGLPSYFGGYKGSDLRAEFALSQASCADLANAWLLVEEGGYRSISASILKRVGDINIDQDYITSKSFKSIINPPNSRWGTATKRIYNQYLLKPIVARKLRERCEVYRHTVNKH